MIQLTKINDETIFLNPNLIEIVETTPDTLIFMMSGKKYYVLESVEEVRERFMDYYIKIHKQSLDIK